MGIEIIWKVDRSYHDKTFVIWDYEVDWLINPDRKPTDEEREQCPKMFTCFACMRKRKEHQLGGRYHGKWLCDECIPYVNEWVVGAMIWWDEHRKSRKYGTPPVPRPALTKADRLESMVAVVRWAKTNGYPLS